MKRFTMTIMGCKINSKRIILLTASRYATSKTLKMTKQFKINLLSKLSKKTDKIIHLTTIGKLSRKKADLLVRNIVNEVADTDSYCVIHTRCLALINAFIDAGGSDECKVFLDHEFLFIRSEVFKGSTEYYMLPMMTTRKDLLTLRACLLDPRGL